MYEIQKAGDMEWLANSEAAYIEYGQINIEVWDWYLEWPLVWAEVISYIVCPLNKTSIPSLSIYAESCATCS